MIKILLALGLLIVTTPAEAKTTRLLGANSCHWKPASCQDHKKKRPFRGNMG